MNEQALIKTVQALPLEKFENLINNPNCKYVIGGIVAYYIVDKLIKNKYSFEGNADLSHNNFIFRFAPQF